jgi:hypothetical protein
MRTGRREERCFRCFENHGIMEPVFGTPAAIGSVRLSGAKPNPFGKEVEKTA